MHVVQKYHPFATMPWLVITNGPDDPTLDDYVSVPVGLLMFSTLCGTAYLEGI